MGFIIIVIIAIVELILIVFYRFKLKETEEMLKLSHSIVCDLMAALKLDELNNKNNDKENKNESN